MHVKRFANLLTLPENQKLCRVTRMPPQERAVILGC